ncbi:hypothetical protein ACT3R7_11895 [Halomonas sp. AOP43-A1-21]
MKAEFIALDSVAFKAGILTILAAEITQWTYAELLEKTLAVRERLGLEDHQLTAAIAGQSVDDIILLVGGCAVNKARFEEHKAQVQDEELARGLMRDAVEAASVGSEAVNEDGESIMQSTVDAFNAVTGCDLSEAEGFIFLALERLTASCQGNGIDYPEAARFVTLTGQAEAKRQRRVGMSAEVAL